MNLVSDIRNAFDSDCYTLGVFIDLSKAFNTVDHDILLAKLKHYGIRNNDLLRFEDYLTNRRQCVQYGTEKTTQKSIKCGAPHGSILGPLLFLLYVNDLHKTSDILNFILFAEDTNIFHLHNNIKTLYETVNREFRKIEKWFNPSAPA